MLHRTIILIGLLFLIGCGPQLAQPVTFVNVRKGSAGLVFDFAEGFPPDKVFEDSQLLLALELKNDGAEDIEGGILALSLERDYMGIKSWNTESRTLTSKNKNTATFRLEGKKQTNPKGDQDVVMADLESLILERQTETHTVNLIVSACYPYRTIFAENTCIDTDIFGAKPVEKNCKVEEKSFTGQGGPVAVTKIEPQMIPAPDKTKIIPQYIITIENVGNGQIIDRLSLQNVCSSSPVDKDTYNKLSLKATLSDVTMDCKDATFTLRDKKKTTICKAASSVSKSLGSFLAPLLIELEYGYTETIGKEIEIRRLG